MIKKRQTILRTYFTFAVIGGLVCTGLLLNLPKDPDSRWLLGYSLQRLVLLGTALAALVTCLWMAYKTWRDHTWADRWLLKFSVRLQRDENQARLLGLLLVFIIVGALFVIRTYTHSDFRLRPDLLLVLESLRSYMLRVAPFVLWADLLSLGALGLAHHYGLWEKTHYQKAISWISIAAVPFILLVIYLVDRIDTRYYQWITREDDLVEWLTVVCLLLAGLFSFIKGLQIRKRQAGRYWFFWVFALATIFLSLEEISWGQRILGVESSQFFMENSDQQEINVHNVLQEWFSFRTKHVVSLALFLYGTVLPLLALNPRIEALFAKTGIPIPPRVLSLGFAMSAGLAIDVFSGREEEVGELCLSLCLFLFMVLEYLRDIQSNPTASEA